MIIVFDDGSMFHIKYEEEPIEGAEEDEEEDYYRVPSWIVTQIKEVGGRYITPSQRKKWEEISAVRLGNGISVWPLGGITWEQITPKSASIVFAS